MTFGTPTLTSPRKPRRGGSKAKLYDCGNGRRLSVRQIALRAGLSYMGVSCRIRAGITGAALLEPKGASRAPAKGTLRTIARLVRAFPYRVPTTAEIRRVVPMSEATASRYRAALRESLEGES